jgi:two-component system, OmpR family, response regulator VicR
MKRILVAQNAKNQSLLVREALEGKGFETMMALDGNQVLSLFDSYVPDLLVLDVLMPGKNGFEVAEIIRKKNGTVPIIFLTAKTATSDVLKGFCSGANDYIPKPFYLDELIARIAVQLQSRIEPPNSIYIYTFGSFEFDSRRQVLNRNGKKWVLSFKESELLKALIGVMNQVLKKEKILSELWNGNNVYNSRNMDVVITRIRQYLKLDERVKIINVRGVGYKLVVEN